MIDPLSIIFVGILLCASVLLTLKVRSYIKNETDKTQDRLSEEKRRLQRENIVSKSLRTYSSKNLSR